MLTKKEIYLKASQELKKKQHANIKSNTLKFKIAIAKCPDLKHLIQKLQHTEIKLIKLIFIKNKSTNFQNSNLIKKIQNENIQIQKKIKTLLIQNKFPSNFLDTTPYCKICNDSGIVANEHCNCFKTLLIKIATNELKKISYFEIKNFNEFDLNAYDKNKLTEQNISEYKQMSTIKTMCETFAKEFPNVHYGILMYGDTGLGKTHLCLAIANKIIQKCFNVTYLTAPELVKKISNQYFENQQNLNEINFLELINKTDLLIIDDLGAEIKSQTNISKIFEIVNIRTSLKKPLILNTNLNILEIEKRYGKRITSRIFNNLKIMQFVGSDHRNRFKQNTLL